MPQGLWAYHQVSILFNWKLPGPVLQGVWINFIFIDNVCKLCLSCNIKNPRHLPNCLKITETSIVLIVFNGIIYHIHPYTVPIFYCLSTWITYQKSYILVSNCHKYIKKRVSIQCSLTTQIEPVQDKMLFLCIQSFWCHYHYNTY